MKSLAFALASTTDHHPAPCVSRLEFFPTATTSDIHSLLVKSPTTSGVLEHLVLSRAAWNTPMSLLCLRKLKYIRTKLTVIDRYQTSLLCQSYLKDTLHVATWPNHMTANNLLKDINQHTNLITARKARLLEALDRRYIVILVLLDMSAAFHTANHEIRLSHLGHRYGMAGSALAWMRSYLTDRSQCVYLQGGASVI